MIEQRVVGGSGVATITTDTVYTATGSGLQVATSGAPVVGSPNGSTVSTSTDLLGRVTQYVDVWGSVTSPSYEVLTGRLLAVTTTPPGRAAEVTSFSYDADGKPTSVSVRGEVVATPSYDAVQQLQSVAYVGGAALSGIGRDAAGRVVGQSWTLPGGGALTDQVVRSQAGRVVQHTLEHDPGTGATGAAATAGAAGTVGAVESFSSTYGYDGAGRLVRRRSLGISCRTSSPPAAGVVRMGRRARRATGPGWWMCGRRQGRRR